MNKKLLLLGAIGVLSLSACSMFTGSKADVAIDELAEKGAALKEFQGHNVVTKVKDGEEYYMGIYRKNEDLMRFANGEYHTDTKDYYPFYMSTTSGTTDGAATVTVKMINKIKKTFGLQVNAPGKVWDGKYIGVYGSISSVGQHNPVTSLALLDDPNQTEYDTITNKTQVLTSERVTCSGVFQFFGYYENEPVCAPAVIYKNEFFGEETAAPKFFGTGHDPKLESGETKVDYFSMDSKLGVDAIDIDTYDLMHLYTL